MTFNFQSFWKTFFLILAFIQVGCTSTKLLRDKDYKYSLAAARSGNFSQALKDFPRQKEQGGFITTLEQAYLGLWDGTSQSVDVYNSLQDQTKTFSERQYMSVTRESEVFFFQESPDGYIPSEHEVIILHLISAQLQLKLGKIEEAQVELRRASYLLQGAYAVTPKGEEQKKFDDPALRIWAGSLWAHSGDWAAAQVDFRKASELLQSPEDKERMRSLAELSGAPKEIELTFYGVGPELLWQESNFEPIFVQNQKSTKPVHGKNEVQVPTQAWYQRHLERNSAIRDTLLKSNYMTQFIGVKTEKGIKKGATAAVVGSVNIVGVVVVGVAVATAVYVAIAGGSGGGQLGAYILGGGFLLASSVWKRAEELNRELSNRIAEDEQRTFEDMRTYRFVRFLPQQISIRWKEDPLSIGEKASGLIMKQVP